MRGLGLGCRSCSQSRETLCRKEHDVLVGLAGAAANRGEEEVDAEGPVLVDKAVLDLLDLHPQHLGRVAKALGGYGVGYMDWGGEAG